MNDVLEFLDKDRQRIIDFFNDIISNKKLSESESVELITKVLSDYNDKLLETIKSIERQKNDSREDDLPKFYKTILKRKGC